MLNDCFWYAGKNGDCLENHKSLVSVQQKISQQLQSCLSCWTWPFFSKKLSGAERNYSTYDRELLAIYEAIKYNRDCVKGRQLIVRTDHKPLTFAFQQKSKKATPRQARQLDFISQFSTEVIHLSGQKNIVADALSRIALIDNCPVIVNTEELAEEQQKDEEL